MERVSMASSRSKWFARFGRSWGLAALWPNYQPMQFRIMGAPLLIGVEKAGDTSSTEDASTFVPQG